uniref:Serpentine receptor class gamma n=1 Tax=Angiostrongylus cantonensis TaxID=6313 RepID=A0A158PBH1_ANGCA
LVGSSTDEEAARRDALEKQEREFHEFVRQQIICLIIFISLYLLSYWMISLFKSKSESDSLYAGDEDYFVYRISAWICSASLAISIGSVALLPFSVLSSELLHRYPDNYYLQWMSWSLINSLWNYVFALSNLSLFVLLPFSYFFIESQGFSKNKNGIMHRVYETLAVCALLIVVILCLVDIVLALISSSVSLITITSVNLPLIYSFVSFAGVMLLLLSTPIGFAKIFTLVGEMTMVGVFPAVLFRYQDVYKNGTSLLMVLINTLKLVFGYRSLPVYAQYMEVHTRHSLGLVGVVIESIIIMYVMATSLIGFYSVPFIRTLRPHRARTSLTVIIINCSIVLVLSSALPVLANTIGITSFDLLGAYSSLKWLNNFKLVLMYNMLFAAATTVCVFSQVTIPVRKQVVRR